MKLGPLTAHAPRNRGILPSRFFLLRLFLLWCWRPSFILCCAVFVYRCIISFGLILFSFLPFILPCITPIGVRGSPMRRFSTRALLQAKPPLLSARSPLPLPLFLSAPRSAPALRPTATTRPRPRSPLLSQTSKRYCSYRRMCGTRRGEVSGSTNVQGREVLPTNVKPVHYDLTLEPNFEKFTYDGAVVIEYANTGHSL